MEQADEIIEALRAMGSPSIKKVLVSHGAPEPVFGVKIGDLKPIERRLKPNYALGLALYESGISDAMYLAGLIMDDPKMTREDLQRWVDQANWSLHYENTVPWVAAGNPLGDAMAREWIESSDERIAAAGWWTLSSLAAVRPDTELDLAAYAARLQRVDDEIAERPAEIRRAMVGYVVCTASYISSLTHVGTELAHALDARTPAGLKSPGAAAQIAKVVARGTIGKKRKSAKC